jgi:hypothetical protein
VSRAGALLIAGFVLAACGTPAAPSHPVSGTWVGTVSDTVAGQGTATVSLNNQAVVSLLGTWRFAYADPQFDGYGTAGVMETSGKMILTLQPDAAVTMRCGAHDTRDTGFLAAYITVSGSQMTGDWTSSGCARGGTLSLTRK